jgi:hypothetical protein
MHTLAKHGDLEIQKQAEEVVKEIASDKILDEWWRNWWSKKTNEGIGWLAEQLGYKGHRFQYPTLSAFVHSSPALMDFYLRKAKEGIGVTLETKPGVSDENRELAETVVFSILAAFAGVSELFAQQMQFGFDDEIRDIATRIKTRFS